jgi:PAS domain S-box-containing protein
MQKTPEQSADARISDFEEKVRHLEQERDAAVNQVKELQAVLREKEAEGQPEFSAQEAVGSASLILETILENVPDGLAISDLSGRVTYCSQDGIKMSGMSREEMSGSTPEKRRLRMALYKPDGTTPADLDELPLVQVLRTGKPVMNRELLIRHRNGKEIPIRSNAAPIRDREGNLIGAIHLWRDISEQKRTEEALRESHEKFHTFFMTTPVLTTVSTVKDGRILDVNRAFETVTGYTREEVIGKTSYELNIWRRCEDRARFGKILLNNTPLREEEAEITTKFGEQRTVLISAETIELAGEKCIIASAQDITSRKQSEERLRALVAASSDVLYRMSPDWNEMRQLNNESFLAQTTEPDPNWLQEYIVPEDQAYVAAIIKKAIRTKNVFELEHRVRRANGSLGWTHSRAVPILDAEGDIIEWFGAASDITERKQAEEELRRAHALIEGIAAGTDDMIAAVDGEFRYLFFNDAYRREFRALWGQDIEVGASMIETLAPWPEEQHKARELWSRALAGESYQIRMEFGSERERRIYDLRFNPIRDSQGRQIGAAHILREVTEQVRMQRALVESEEHARRIIDNNVALVGIMTPDGTLIEANATALRAGGLQREDVVGKKFWDCYWWSYDVQMQAQLRQKQSPRPPAARVCGTMWSCARPATAACRSISCSPPPETARGESRT